MKLVIDLDGQTVSAENGELNCQTVVDSITLLMGEAVNLEDFSPMAFQQALMKGMQAAAAETDT